MPKNDEHGHPISFVFDFNVRTAPDGVLLVQLRYASHAGAHPTEAESCPLLAFEPQQAASLAGALQAKVLDLKAPPAPAVLRSH
jgi:hypothetical protein